MGNTYLPDIVDLDTMEAEIASGFLVRRFHQNYDHLAIVGYTDKTQFDNHWTPTTRALRGVIYDTETLRVLARPFAKFFNYGDEANTTELDPDQPLVNVYDKVDGSLGIVYSYGRPSVATRGSFHSEQAEHATELLRKDPLEVEAVQRLIWDNKTPLYEIIYPENRIVVDYGERDTLVYLGYIDNETGAYKGPAGYGKDQVNYFFHQTIREAIESEPRKNAEGFVMWLDEFTPIKFKYDEYKSLHRIISNLTVKEVWRQLRDGTYEDYVLGLPDEFQAWAVGVAGELQDQADELAAQVYLDYREHVPLLAQGRKEFALAIQGLTTRPYLFSLADGRDITPAIMKAIEPMGKDTSDG